MNNMIKKAAALTAAVSMSAMILGGCTKNDGGVTSDTSAQGTEEAASEVPTVEAIYGEIRTDYNTALDMSDYPLTPNDVPDGFEAVFEAEDGVLAGGCKVQDYDGASGGKYVSELNKAGDSLTFNVSVDNSGFYDMDFISQAPDPKRVNYVSVDGEQVGEIQCDNVGVYGDSYMKNVYLAAGAHDVTITPYWGYTAYDCLKLTKSTAVTADTYKITAELSNPNADEHTKALYKFLCDVYGKYSLTGQYADEGRKSSEYEKIKAATGDSFAVLGLDMSGYSPCSVANGSDSNTVEYAYDWYANAGGIVQLCWHWTTPEEYCLNSAEQPWYRSFYKEATNIDLDKIMNGEDEKGYELLMRDIDAISLELARLRDSGVPVLWRPLHEAAGGWFWWGNCSAESYKKLWNVMYDKMTNEHNLTNLIWMWNGQDAEWYPGDDTVDIVSWDIYAGNHVYTSYTGTFTKCVEMSGENKLVALSENGCVMDPDNVMRDNARWLFWGTWSDPFTMKLGVVLNEEYTEKDLLIKAYNHDRTLTLGELPDLKNYK